MITIKPFAAIRPRNDLYSSIACPPYDVMSLQEAREIERKNPLSFVKVIRSEIDFDDNTDPHSEIVYKQAKINFENYIAKGFLIQDDSPCFYVYKQKKGILEQTGFVGAVSTFDYDNGSIKRHENTRPEKVKDRFNHMMAINAHSGYVFLTYRKNEYLNNILGKIEKETPDVNFISDDNIEHSLWVIKEQNTINDIKNGFENIQSLYIADGHHRAEASSQVSKALNDDLHKEAKYFLSIIYPSESLKILPYNRAVKDLNKKTINDLISGIKENFIIEKVQPNDGLGYKPLGKKQIGMYLDNSWYLLTAKDHIINNDAVDSLDVSILQNFILDPLLGIKNPTTDKRIDFIGGARGSSALKDIVDKKEFAVSFSMYPTSIDQLLSVADNNKLMPPKSTWFDPKPRSGMTIHLLS